MNLLSEFVNREQATPYHACHKIATASNSAKRPRQNLSPSLSLSFTPLFSLHLFFSLIHGGHSRVFVVESGSEDARSQHMVPSCVPRLRSKNLPLAGRNVHVSRSSSSATFDILPDPAHTPSPIPFRHNNRAVSQRVFNGRRLHATRPRAGPPRPLPHRVASTLLLFLFLSSFFSSLSFSTALFLPLTSSNASLSSSSSCIFLLS